MTDGPFVADGEEPDSQQSSQDFEPRWWWWAALVGLVFGWVIGLNVKLDVEDLHQAALGLIPPSAEVAKESVVEGSWFLFTPYPALAHLYLRSDADPDQLVEAMGTMAERSDWRLGERSQGPTSIVLSLRSLFLEGSVGVWPSGDPSADTDHDAWIRVEGREGVGQAVTASASLATGLVAASGAGLFTRRRRGGPSGRRHTPLRWWHLVGVAFLALVFRASLHFVL